MAPVEREGRIALQDVEALLDGVEVRRDVAGPVELAQREAGVHRAHATPDQVRPPVPRAVLGVPLGHGRVDLPRPPNVVDHVRSVPPSTCRLTPLIARVLEQEDRRVGDLAHRHEPPGRRPRADPVEEGRRLARPRGAVADDPRVESVDPDRSELDRQRVHHPGDAAVDRADRRRAGVGPILRQAAEEQDRRVLGHLGKQRVDGLDVADELQRHKLCGALEIELPGAVVVPLDRRQHEALDVDDSVEVRRDLAGRREVERDAARLAADLTGDLRGSGGVAAGEHDPPSAGCEGLGDRPADAGGAADDDDRALRHRAPRPAEAGAGAPSGRPRRARARSRPGRAPPSPR